MFVTLFSAVGIILGFLLVKIFMIDLEVLTKNKILAKLKKLFISAVISFCLGLLAGIFYIYSYGCYVISIEQLKGNEEVIMRVMVGNEIKKDIRPEGRSEKELLMDYQLDSERIFTPNSLRNARVILLVSFALTFFLLNLGMSIVVSVSHLSGEKNLKESVTKLG